MAETSTRPRRVSGDLCHQCALLVHLISAGHDHLGRDGQVPARQDHPVKGNLQVTFPDEMTRLLLRFQMSAKHAASGEQRPAELLHGSQVAQHRVTNCGGRRREIRLVKYIAAAYRPAPADPERGSPVPTPVAPPHSPTPDESFHGRPPDCRFLLTARGTSRFRRQATPGSSRQDTPRHHPRLPDPTQGSRRSCSPAGIFFAKQSSLSGLLAFRHQQDARFLDAISSFTEWSGSPEQPKLISPSDQIGNAPSSIGVSGGRILQVQEVW